MSTLFPNETENNINEELINDMQNKIISDPWKEIQDNIDKMNLVLENTIPTTTAQNIWENVLSIKLK